MWADCFDRLFQRISHYYCRNACGNLCWLICWEHHTIRQAHIGKPISQRGKLSTELLMLSIFRQAQRARDLGIDKFLVRDDGWHGDAPLSNVINAAMNEFYGHGPE